MATFTGNYIKDTYKSILKLADNLALTSSLKVVQDGLGNSTPMSISTDAVSFASLIEASGYTIPGGTGSQYLRADGTVGTVGAVLDFVDASETIAANSTEDTKAPTTAAVANYVYGVSTASGGTVSIDFSTPNWHVSASGAWSFALSGLSGHIGQAGNIIITNSAATTPGPLPTEIKTPNGDSIIWNTTSGSVSLISYYNVSNSQILINYIGNFS